MLSQVCKQPSGDAVHSDLVLFSLASVKGQFRRCVDRVCHSHPSKAHRPSAPPAVIITSPQNAPFSEVSTAPLTSQQTSKALDMKMMKLFLGLVIFGLYIQIILNRNHTFWSYCGIKAEWQTKSGPLLLENQIKV